MQTTDEYRSTSLVIGETLIKYKVHVELLRDEEAFVQTIHKMAHDCAQAGTCPMTVAIVADPVRGDTLEDTYEMVEHNAVLALYFRTVLRGHPPCTDTTISDAYGLLHIIEECDSGIHLLCYPESYCAR